MQEQNSRRIRLAPERDVSWDLRRACAPGFAQQLFDVRQRCATRTHLLQVLVVGFEVRLRADQHHRHCHVQPPQLRHPVAAYARQCLRPVRREEQHDDVSVEARHLHSQDGVRVKRDACVQAG